MFVGKVRRLVSEDQSKLEEFLLQYVETSMFLLSNAQKVGIEYQGSAYQGEYRGAFDQKNNIVGVVAHYWNDNVMMQAENNAILSEIIDIFKQEHSRPIKGVLGENEKAQLVIDVLPLSKDSYSMNSKERLYTLDLKNLLCPKPNINLSKYQLVSAADIDEDILTKWLKEYRKEALNAKDGVDLDKAVAELVRLIKQKKKIAWVLLSDGEAVSLCASNARLTDIIQLGPVWTPALYRNKGYAKIVVYLSLQKEFELGIKKAVLFTNNESAINVYESVGFKNIGYYRLAIV